jgi:DNA-binding response OmpR family regulator
MARILLIDDDADLSHFLKGELEEHAHHVECLERAEHGPEVVARTAYDLVLLDNKMPGMTGIEFLEALQQRQGTRGPGHPHQQPAQEPTVRGPQLHGPQREPARR